MREEAKVSFLAKIRNKSLTNFLELLDQLPIHGSNECQRKNIEFIMKYLGCSQRTAYDYLNCIYAVDYYQLRDAQTIIAVAEGNQNRKPYHISREMWEGKI